jgi:hypothetical protein
MTTLNAPAPLAKKLYPAVATATGGRNGRVVTDDGKLDLVVVPPAPGATGTNPESVNVGGVMTLNVDKGQQSQGGTAASVTGDIANGIACDVAMQNPTLPYASVTRTHAHTATVKADASGNLHVMVGTDSGFEGTTNIYFQQVKVSLTPVSGPTTPGTTDSGTKKNYDPNNPDRPRRKGKDAGSKAPPAETTPPAN